LRPKKRKGEDMEESSIIKRRTEECVNVYDPSKAYGGYTLFAQHASTDVWLIDMRGRIIHRWPMETPLGGDERLLPNGNLLRINKTFREPSGAMGSVGERLLEVDWEANVVWEHRNPTMHHDFYRFQNGNTLINTHVRVPPEIVKKVKGGFSKSRKNGEIWGSGFQEITPEGKVAWEWIGHEHLDPELDTVCPICPLSIWGYVNGVAVYPNGDIVASFRDLNSIMIIDRKTSGIKWRWGSNCLGHQHNPLVLDNGNVLVFDNGFHRLFPEEYMDNFSIESNSRVLEVDPKTDKVVWVYEDEDIFRFYSPFASSAERLPNGNTLICESSKGRIFEVTHEKEIVWDFVNPFYMKKGRMGLSNYIFRAHRYGYDFPGFAGRDLRPGRFDFVISQGKETQKKSSGPQSEKLTAEEEALRRLSKLGY
jgi:hypothetical protein